MAKLIPFRRPFHKATFQNQNIASRLTIRLPRYDDAGPLVVTITGPAAASIRRDALWHGKTPEQFAIDWLNVYTPERSV